MAQNKLNASESAIFNIYKKKFDSGKIKIPLRKTGANLRGIPWLIYFGPDTTGATPISCGGKEEIISKVGSPSYKECKIIL